MIADLPTDVLAVYELSDNDPTPPFFHGLITYVQETKTPDGRYTCPRCRQWSTAESPACFLCRGGKLIQIKDGKMYRSTPGGHDEIS